MSRLHVLAGGLVRGDQSNGRQIIGVTDLQDLQCQGYLVDEQAELARLRLGPALLGDIDQHTTDLGSSAPGVEDPGDLEEVYGSAILGVHAVRALVGLARNGLVVAVGPDVMVVGVEA